MAECEEIKVIVNVKGEFGKNCHRDHKHDKDCDNYYVNRLFCQPSLVIRQNPPGIPPIVPLPFPEEAYGLATISVTDNLLFVGGLQGFLPDGSLEPIWDKRIRLAYESMFAIARYYGAEPKDLLRLIWQANPDAPDAIAQIPGNFAERFNKIRDVTNAIQAPIYGKNAPSRRIFGTTFVVLDDFFEVEGTFKLPGKNVVCDPRPKYLKAVSQLPFGSNRPFTP